MIAIVHPHFPAEDQARIPYVNFAAQHEQERGDIHAIVERIFCEGQFVGGSAVRQFEQAITDYCDVRHAVALNSGTDALVYALQVLGIGPGDEVITPANSFIASTAAIVQVGAIPVFADVLADQLIDPKAIERAITPATRAIMPVHLTGRMAQMPAIMALAGQHDIAVIEDAAQAIGSRQNGRMAGTIGDVGCFSCHPLKNLNAAGDAGFIISNRSDVAWPVRLCRNHGLESRDKAICWGQVSRMDTLQAAILNFRLSKLDTVILQRRENAARYRRQLADLPVYMPAELPGQFDTYHTFVIQIDRRDALKQYLAENGIETAIHYPVPIHLQPAARALDCPKGSLPATEQQAEQILSLPIHQFLSPQQIDDVCDHIRRFYAES